MKFHWYLFLILFPRDVRYSCSQNNAKIKFLASRQSPANRLKQNRKILFDKNQRRRISCTRVFKFRGLRKMPFLPRPSRVKSKSDNMVFEDKFKHINSRTPDGAKDQANISLRKHKRSHGSRSSGCFNHRKRKRQSLEALSRSPTNRWRQSRAETLEYLGGRRREMWCKKALQSRGFKDRSSFLCPSLLKPTSHKNNEDQSKIRLKTKKNYHGED